VECYLGDSPNFIKLPRILFKKKIFIIFKCHIPTKAHFVDYYHNEAPRAFYKILWIDKYFLRNVFFIFRIDIIKKFIHKFLQEKELHRAFIQAQVKTDSRTSGIEAWKGHFAISNSIIRALSLHASVLWGLKTPSGTKPCSPLSGNVLITLYLQSPAFSF
jgi:hypothetical protein